MDIVNALKRPFDNITNLLIGIVLLIIPLLNLLTIPGYILRLARETMSGNKSLPGFDNFGEIVVDSLKAIVTLLIHFIVFSIIGLILLMIPFIGLALYLIWSIGFMFIMITGVLTLAKTGDIAKAINIPELVKSINIDFALAVVVAVVITGIIMAVISGIVGAIIGTAFAPALIGITDPTALMNMLPTLIASGSVGFIILLVIGYVIDIFAITLIAESYK